MQHGVSYYPEHKTPEDLAWDIKLLKESGINTVRMGEFSWCRMEPEPGHYDFTWLDPVIEELGKAGIRTIVGTPTACPPAWMVERWPDLLYQDNRRIRRPFGGRRHGCYNHEKFREACAAIAQAIGIHYGSSPYVAGFQIDNELAQEGTGRCTCDTCRKKFEAWLERRYGDIQTFNRRSGAIFWSQEYTRFDQINPPVNAIEPGSQLQIRDFYENPTVRLEFERFSSDCQIEFQNIQADILKAHTSHPVTTNGTGLATNSIDYYKGFENLDRYAFDYYPNLRDAWVDSFPYAFGRGIKPGVPFWVLEFMSGGGHRFGGSGRLQPNPGALKQAVVQSFAHGAELMLHFQFRSFPVGAEQLNYAIVDLDGIPVSYTHLGHLRGGPGSVPDGPGHGFVRGDGHRHRCLRGNDGSREKSGGTVENGRQNRYTSRYVLCQTHRCQRGDPGGGKLPGRDHGGGTFSLRRFGRDGQPDCGGQLPEKGDQYVAAGRPGDHGNLQRSV